MNMLQGYILLRRETWSKTLSVLMFFTSAQSLEASQVMALLHDIDTLLKNPTTKLPAFDEQSDSEVFDSRIISLSTLDQIPADHSGTDSLLFLKDGMSEAQLASAKADPFDVDPSLNDSPQNTLSKSKKLASATPSTATLGNFLGSAKGTTVNLVAPQLASENDAPIVPCTSEGCTQAQIAKKKVIQQLAQENTVDGERSIASINDASGLYSARYPVTVASANIAPVSAGHAATAAESERPLDVQGNSKDSSAASPKNEQAVFEPAPVLNEDQPWKTLETFQNAPEGWFIEDSGGIAIRGALDRPYDRANPNSIDNYIQIVLTKEAIAKNPDYKNLTPGVYTIKKCAEGCYTREYKQYADYLKMLDTAPGVAKPVQLPGEIEARTVLFTMNDTPRDFLLKSRQHAAELAAAYAKVRNAEKIAKRDEASKWIDYTKRYNQDSRLNKGHRVRFSYDDGSKSANGVVQDGKLVFK